MSDIKRIAADMSSIMWTCLRAGKDPEGVEVMHAGRRHLVNSAQHGYEATVNAIKSCLDEYQLAPKDLIMVFEGMDGKKRRVMITPKYKSNREGDKDSRSQEDYVQFNILKDMIRKTFMDLGAIAISQDYVEGDDVLGWLAKHTDVGMVIMTNDNDLSVLNGESDQGALVMVRVNKEVAYNKYGNFDFKLITLYKALVGDSSDGVSGCPGFGPKTWENLMAAYSQDDLYELMGLLASGNRDELASIAVHNGCKILRKIVDNWMETLISYKLVKIYPEWVDTIRQPLKWMPGMVIKATNDERLTHWRATKRLVTADNYSGALAFLKAQLAETEEVKFDIETSQCEESDDWLAAQGNPGGVDPLGSTLTGFSLTFGANDQHTIYVSVDHAETKNILMSQARAMIQACFGKPIVIHNTAFELCVLYEAKDEDGSLWRDHWALYGEGGYIPNILDTQFESAYVDENRSRALKFRSKHHLGYEQQSYDETTLLPDRRFKGGQPEGKNKETGEPMWRYKMRELPATHVAGYGCDDTITTAALHNFYRLHMGLDGHYQVYLDVEIDAAYQHAHNFNQGMAVSIAECKRQEREDDKVFDESWATLAAFLTQSGWDGTFLPVFDGNLACKEIKHLYRVVAGLEVGGKVSISTNAEGEDGEEVEAPEEDEAEEEDSGPDPVLKSRVRLPLKLVDLIAAQADEDPNMGTFAALLRDMINGKTEAQVQRVRDFVMRFFTGAPKFKDSPKQMGRLMYEVMQLPIMVRGKVTQKMREKGIREGNPAANALAIEYALRDGTEDQKKILMAIKLMRMVATRRSLYYHKYPYFVHWKTGRIHGAHLQCQTNTRRASAMKPNVQQLPKHAKIEGQKPKFRAVVRPHKKGAVVVSMDFAAQELRVIADYSQDPNMLACYIGDNKKDMHALTGLGILMRKMSGWSAEALAKLTPEQLQADISEQQYMAFRAMENGTEAEKKLYKEYRSVLGKKVNFTTEYGAQAPKLAATMLVSEEEAQTYIDAREDAFSVAKAWKLDVVAEAKEFGFVRSMLGAKRHLAELLASDDRFIASKAERQAVNFKIQGSSAEMTKLAEGRMWRAGLFRDYDAVCYGPVHDEVLASVMIEDLEEFIPKMHACMVAPYAKMTVPIESSISFGPNFLDQIEIGDEPTAEAIQKGLEVMRKVMAESAAVAV